MFNFLRIASGFNKKVYPSYGLERINQVKEGEDAITCVAMLLNYFGQETTIETLRKKFPQYLNITSIEELDGLCSANNLKTQAFYGSYLDIKKISSPAIIYWRMKRFVVLLGVSHETYLVFDPADARVEFYEYEAECHYCELALLVAK